MIIFGSGGHTTEMLMMLGKSNIFSKYEHVHFVIGHSDTWSLNKINDFYLTNLGIKLDTVKNLSIIRVYRAREVKQSYLTSVFTTLYAMLHSFIILLRLSVFSHLDLVLTNGPGTAIPICWIYWFISKVLLFNIKAKIMFVESFCRVEDLSLTAKLLRPILNKFIV